MSHFHFLTGGPAFPGQFFNDSGANAFAPDGQVVAPDSTVTMPGATLRDVFAGQAMTGFLAGFLASLRNACPECGPIEPIEYAGAIADQCYLLADAMIARRGKLPTAD